MTILDGFQSYVERPVSLSEDIETAHGPDAPRHIVTATVLESGDQSASAPALAAESESEVPLTMTTVILSTLNPT
jgi:hypothetical protein